MEKKGEPEKENHKKEKIFSQETHNTYLITGHTCIENIGRISCVCLLKNYEKLYIDYAKRYKNISTSI